MPVVPRGRAGRRLPQLDGAVRRTVLQNGLQVVTEDIRSTSTYALGVFVSVGSRHETPSLHGASHFLEHLLFKGTPNRTAEQISATIESVGGELNAYTAKEHTCFYARVLHSDAELALDVLTDMIAHSLITPQDVDAERAVILDEISMHSDDPAELAAEAVSAEVFGKSGLGRPVIGSAPSVVALTRRQIVNHWRRHYRPGCLVVAAAGKADHDRLVERLSALEVQPSPAARPRPGPSAISRRGGLLTRRLPLEQCSAVLAFPSSGVFDARRYPLGLLSLIIGGGMASRLFVEVRERRGLTYTIDAGETAYSDAGLWSVEWQCAPGKLVQILELVRATLADVAAHGVTEDELVRAKGQMRGQTALSYEGPGSRMSRLGVNAILGDERTLGELLRCFDEVTSDQVRAEAELLFTHPPTLAIAGARVPARRIESVLSQW
ncbi:MAG TPA: pitrilysin family protein [Propionibacteriaceae bacterium]|jgi:predicted Zn-dependent peptidase|nr:pitrilysin family protein [Propionibacteriaceae bacterium]